MKPTKFEDELLQKRRTVMAPNLVHFKTHKAIHNLPKIWIEILKCNVKTVYQKYRFALKETESQETTKTMSQNPGKAAKMSEIPKSHRC